MNLTVRTSFTALLITVFVACSGEERVGESTSGEHGSQAATYDRGEHGGRMLRDGAFAIELAIFEQGVPPEFRVWVTSNGAPIDPGEVDVEVRLTRTGDRVDRIGFAAEGDYLRGDHVVYEPHSFLVTLEARAMGQSYRWEYENFEGRTEIDDVMAAALGIETSIAGPAMLEEVIQVYGRIVADPARVRVLAPRYEGLIRSVDAALGDDVVAGQRLVTIEGNESLQPYTLTAPIGGTISERNANPGEQTDGRRLLTILDTSRVWANLAVYLKDRDRISEGTPVTIVSPDTGKTATGEVDHIEPVTEASQSVVVRVELDNLSGAFPPGTFVKASIRTAEYEVPLAVKRDGLQAFRDFTVVYGKFGETYEVRMLDLGRQDGEWVEVLGGIEPGTAYVSTNSYVVKADVEKSGASHDH